MNEFELIKMITHGAPVSLDGLVCGVGDDCSVVTGHGGRDYLITTDALFEGVHFRPDWISPKTLGRKALAVNISDISAMGGRPLYYLVSIGVPDKFPVKDIEALFDGMKATASAYRMHIIGGDTCGSKKGLLISITAIGEVEHAKCLYRKGAAPGDVVYVTGTFGGSALGLSCLEKGLRGIEMREYIRRHDEPTPRVATGLWLASSSCVSSMIDVSDGLAGDLGHIAETSGVGIKVHADAIPLPEGFIQAAASCQKDPHALALTGGEDYELAFTVSKNKEELFEKMLKVVLPTFNHKITKIGEVVEGKGVEVVDMHGAHLPLASKGFEHKF